MHGPCGSGNHSFVLPDVYDSLMKSFRGTLSGLSTAASRISVASANTLRGGNGIFLDGVGDGVQASELDCVPDEVGLVVGCIVEL